MAASTKAPAAPTGQAHASPHRVVLKLAVGQDLRYISHRDTMRMLARALCRAELPLAYSQGFNPHVKLSMPVARAVGMACTDDPVVLQLTREVPRASIADALRAQLPQGLELKEVVAIPEGHKPDLRSLSYALELQDEAPADLDDRIEHLLQAQRCWIEPQDHLGRPKGRLDIRPFIEQLVCSEKRLQWRVKFCDGRTVAPRELLHALGIDWKALRHHIVRIKVEWYP